MSTKASHDPPSEYVLGVDGGGSKTVAWLARLVPDAEDGPVGVGQSGPGNPRAVGFSSALGNIRAAVDAAFAAAGISPRTVASACLALAGADRVEEREPIQQWGIEQRLARNVQVTNDAEPLLAAASPTGCGIALICGTGSFAIGRSVAGETARCGGWGYLLGDEGSGYALGLAGLRAAVRAADGRDPPTVLLERFLQRLGITTASELVPILYRAGMSRQRIAEMAEVVLVASRAGDEAAQRVVREAARELAALVQTLRRRLGLVCGEYPLALAGGVIVHADELRQRLSEALAASGDSPGAVELVPDPARGAVLLARRACTV